MHATPILLKLLYLYQIAFVVTYDLLHTGEKLYANRNEASPRYGKNLDTCQDIGGWFFYPRAIFEKANYFQKTQLFSKIFRLGVRILALKWNLFAENPTNFTWPPKPNSVRKFLKTKKSLPISKNPTN